MAFNLCASYFLPSSVDLNRVSLRYPEVAKGLLKTVDGVDLSIRNNAGFTPLDLVNLMWQNFDQQWKSGDIPKHPTKQKEEGRR